MTVYVIRRLLYLIPIMIFVGTFVFLLIHIAPGDPTSYLLSEEATEIQRQAMRERLGLDQPMYVQYFRWFSQLIRGDLGESISLRQPVSQALIQRLEPTFIMAILALSIACLIGIPGGIIAALKHDTYIDQILMSIAMFGLCIPNFWLALMLALLFGVYLGWVPLVGYTPFLEDPVQCIIYLLIPAFVLGFSGRSAAISRLTRANVLETMGKDYIRTARSKGLSERVVIFKHALRNAMIPTITVIGASLGGLLGGAVIVENIFSIPGIGQLLVASVHRRDYPALQGAVIFVAAIFVLANLAVDITYVLIDPRIRYD